MSPDRFEATYLIETPLDPAHVAEVLAGEQSCGTFTRVEGETDALRERARATVESVELLDVAPAPSLPNGWMQRRGMFDTPQTWQRARLRVSFPCDNIGPNLPTLAATVSGNLFDLGEATGLRLEHLALPPALLFRMYSTLNQALGRPQLVTWLQVAGLFVKIPLSVWFTFGGAGLPAMGVVGCAWATLVVNYTQCGLALWLLRTQDIYAPLHFWHRMERPDWKQMGRFARLGVPAALAITVEVTSFTLMALFIARQGTLAAAGHQIAANIAAVLYMVPLSFAIATSARVSYWRGAGNEMRARQAVLTGFWVSSFASIALAAILFIAKSRIASVYSQQTEVVLLTAGLLAWVAAYHLVDAVQILCIFLLRCYRITLAPLVVYGGMLWGLGLGGGYWMAYHGLGPLAPLRSPTPFWAASSAALGVTAAVFAWMLARALKAAQHQR